MSCVAAASWRTLSRCPAALQRAEPSSSNGTEISASVLTGLSAAEGVPAQARVMSPGAWLAPSDRGEWACSPLPAGMASVEASMGRHLRHRPSVRNRAVAERWAGDLLGEAGMQLP